MKAQDKWDMKKLPIMPPEFELAPAEKMGGRVNVLRKLIKTKTFWTSSMPATLVAKVN